jgi:hypothetical protein
MRLKARTSFQYDGVAYTAEDLLDAPDQEALGLINRDHAMPWNLEDPKQRSEIVEAPSEPLPDVPPVTISPTSDDMGSGSGAGVFAVTMTGPGTSGTWTVDKDGSATWLTYSPITPQSTDGQVSYNVTANTGPERVAHFYVNGKTFTVTQAGVAARRR